MRFVRPRPSRRLHPSILLASLVALVVALTGFETVTHGHVPAVAGWHDSSPHGTAAHDDGLKSCSICRLAHESSSAPIAPLNLTRPERVVLASPPDCKTRALSVLARERSPRAPPRSAAC
jgi:hypothetical protein